MTPSEPSCLQVLFCWWSQMSEQKPRARLGLGFSTVSSPVWFIYLLISIFNNVCYFNHPTIIYCYNYYYFNMESTLKCSIVGKVAYRKVVLDFIQVHFGCSEDPGPAPMFLFLTSNQTSWVTQGLWFGLIFEYIFLVSMPLLV